MIPFIRPDRANHFIYGALAFVFAAAVAQLLGVGVLTARLAGTCAAVALGVGKELRDRWANRRARAKGLPEPHGVERADAAWTAAGGLVVLMGSVAAG